MQEKLLYESPEYLSDVASQAGIRRDDNPSPDKLLQRVVDQLRQDP